MAGLLFVDPTMDTAEFEAQVQRQLQALVPPGDDALLIGVSGGCDSVVLLYLLRFAVPGYAARLRAAHLDHAMRPGSRADAAWVAGLCRAWGVPLRQARLEQPPAGEAAAREARHAFLHHAARAERAACVLLAHHADDQAETVLFRILRGTGLRGLRGMAAHTHEGLVRPLLPFWRAQVRAYARALGLRWREDPTNLETGARRNRLRNELIPRLEAEVAPGARRSLVRLAALAREAEAEAEEGAARAEHALVRTENGALLLARSPLRGYSSGFATRVLRRVLRRFGLALDRAGTRAALQFITAARSGRRLRLRGGVTLTVEFDAVRITREAAPGPERGDAELEVAGTEGSGRLALGGAEYRVCWRPAGSEPAASEPPARWSVVVGAAQLPLRLRGWRPGDRLATPRGTRKLKQLFGERRVPLTLRARLPVLADAGGTVLWVAGLDDDAAVPPVPTHDTALILSIVDD